ncbi:MAG TPA: PKD domain-containing protein [Caldilineaceae bacterium]|nr:PKD domain-containing protein [Caldilineaceae bacterium]
MHWTMEGGGRRASRSGRRLLSVALLALLVTTGMSGASPEGERTAQAAMPDAGLSVTSSGPAEVGEAVLLSAGPVADGEVGYMWDFGDGRRGSGATVRHTYMAAGDYMVTVTARSDAGEQQARIAVQVADHVVRVIDSDYDPRELTIDVGDRVIWTFDAFLPHSVTADDGSFEQPLGTNWPDFSHTFDEAGEFDYHCSLHGGPNRIGMSGTVTVEGSVPPPPPENRLFIPLLLS